MKHFRSWIKRQFFFKESKYLLELKASHRTSCVMYETFLICLRMRTASEKRVSLLLAECWAHGTGTWRYLCNLAAKETHAASVCVCVKSQTFPSINDSQNDLWTSRNIAWKFVRCASQISGNRNGGQANKSVTTSSSNGSAAC